MAQPRFTRLALLSIAGLMLLGLTDLAFAWPSTRLVWTGNRSVLFWITKLQSDNEWERYHASHELGKLGPRAAPAVPALIGTLKSRQPLRKPYSGGIFTYGDQAPAAAREALVSIGPAAIPALTKALEHDDALTRVNAAWALWNVKKQSDGVLPVLLPAWKLNELFLKDECIRRDASDALGEIGQAEPDRIVPILLDALQDEDEEIVYAAMYVLRLIGPRDERVIKALVTQLQDQRKGVSNYAGRQLREVGPSVVPPLVAALTDKDAELRWRAAWTLGGMKPEQAKPAVPALKIASQDDDGKVREWATWALEQIDAPKR